ncbi:MAG: OmpA family protein [Desulfobacula sp.]|jgi:chemotaxis protein MotB
MKFEDQKTPLLTAEDDELSDFYDEIMSYYPERKKNRWSVVWSDLMMMMFFFFTVMYVFQISSKDLSSGEGKSKNKPLESGSGEVVNPGVDSSRPEVYDQTRQAISEVMMNQPDSVELRKDGTIKIVLAGDFLFDPGKVDLKISARYQLDQIARVLNENDFLINIVGHTDDSPTRADLYPTNWELSSKRAIMVARYLTETSKVDEKRIFVSAYSSFQPVKRNDTARNRELNRRVEIILLKQTPNEENSR